MRTDNQIPDSLVRDVYEIMEKFIRPLNPHDVRYAGDVADFLNHRALYVDEPGAEPPYKNTLPVSPKEIRSLLRYLESQSLTREDFLEPSEL